MIYAQLGEAKNCCHLFNVQQNKGEPVKKFASRFYQVVEETEDPTNNVIIKSFTIGISAT